MKRFIILLFIIMLICLPFLVGRYFQFLLSKGPVWNGSTKNESPQLGAFFYYWYHCPAHYCDKNYMPYIPSNIDAYSDQDLGWYEDELKSMHEAGIDTVLPASWGSRNPDAAWFQDTTDIPLLVQAATNIHSPLKIALFDDTSSEFAEWNMDHKRGYQQPDHPEKQEKMPLDDPKNWIYFYDHKIQPFYKMVPKQMWATHNKKSIEDGGRPLIVVYKANWFSKLEGSAKLWKTVKQRFHKEYGVEPFIILDRSWFLYPNGWQLEEVADGKYNWSGSSDDQRRQTLRDFTTVSLNPGVSCTNNKSDCTYFRLRNVDFTTHFPGDEGSRLRSMYQALVPGSNLVLLETWNELWEGTMIDKSPFYPRNEGGHLEEDYYIKLLKQLSQNN